MKKSFMRLVLLVGVVAITITSGEVQWAETSPHRVEVTAKKFSFDPAEITLKKGEPVTLVLKSMDVSHGLRFRELNVDVRVRAGSTSVVQFTPNKTGDFVGHCSIFCGSGHGGMKLMLHVVD